MRLVSSVGRVGRWLVRILAAPFVTVVSSPATITGWLTLAAGGWRCGLLWAVAITASVSFAGSVVCRVWICRTDSHHGDLD